MVDWDARPVRLYLRSQDFVELSRLVELAGERVCPPPVESAATGYRGQFLGIDLYASDDAEPFDVLGWLARITAR